MGRMADTDLTLREGSPIDRTDREKLEAVAHDAARVLALFGPRPGGDAEWEELRRSLTKAVPRMRVPEWRGAVGRYLDESRGHP